MFASGPGILAVGAWKHDGRDWIRISTCYGQLAALRIHSFSLLILFRDVEYTFRIGGGL
jgi:hypothetical protein